MFDGIAISGILGDFGSRVSVVFEGLTGIVSCGSCVIGGKAFEIVGVCKVARSVFGASVFFCVYSIWGSSLRRVFCSYTDSTSTGVSTTIGLV